MPIWDFECDQGHINESICGADVDHINCPDCGARARKIITASGQYCGNEDADWIRSVREVVGSDNPNPVAQRFMKNPTRRNYRKWMKSEGLRPLERGESGTSKPEPFNLEHHTKLVAQERMKRHRISVR